MKRALLMSVAVLVGYVLGRRRNLRAALMLGAAAAAGRASANRGSLLAQGRRLLGGEGAVGELSGLARPLVEAGKAAARTAVTDRIDSVSDRLRDRSDALRGRKGPKTEGRKDEDEGREARGPEDEEYEAEFEEEEEEEPEPVPRRAARPRAQRHEPEPERGRQERDRNEAEPPVRRRPSRSGQR